MTPRQSDMSHVPPEIREKLKDAKVYSLVVLRKGPNHDRPDAGAIIQGQHLPYVFDLRAKGIMLLSSPVLADAEFCAIGFFGTPDAAEVRKYMDGDPAIVAGLFKYEVLPILGLPGDGWK